MSVDIVSILSLYIFLFGKKCKYPIKCVITISGLSFCIAFKVSSLVISKSGDIAIASLVKKSSIGNK